MLDKAARFFDKAARFLVKRHGSALERHRFAGERHGTAIKRHKAARIKDFEGFHDFSPLLGLSGPGGDLRRLGAGGYGKIRNPVKRHKAARILPLCAALQRPGGAFFLADGRPVLLPGAGVGTEKNSHPAPTGLIAILFLSFFDTNRAKICSRTAKGIDYQVDFSRCANGTLLLALRASLLKNGCKITKIA